MKSAQGSAIIKGRSFCPETGELFYVLAVTFVLLLGGAVSFYFLERGANKAVESIGSAVYWAFIYDHHRVWRYFSLHRGRAGGRRCRGDLGLGEENPWIGDEITRNITQFLCSRLRKADEDTIKLTTALSLALSK